MKVVELTSYVAAPTCGMLFVEAGHDVLKVRCKDGWEKHSAAYRRLNGSKVVCEELVLEGADIFLTNLPADKLRARGLDYSTIHEQYPDLVYGHMTAYDDGRAGFDHTAFWAESGLMDLMETPRTPPYGVGDTIAGLLLYARLLTAAPGEYVQVSLYEAGQFVTEQHRLVGHPYPLQFRSPYGNTFKQDGEWYMSDGKQAVPILTLAQKQRR